MKKILLAYLSCTVLLVLVFVFHYMYFLHGFLGDDYGTFVWKSEVMGVIFWPPLKWFFILQTLLILIGYLGGYWLLKVMDLDKSRFILITFIILALVAGAMTLGLFEPILATDYFEYGTRQDLNRIFEFIGYTRINVTVYIYLALTAILTWFVVDKETNKSEIMSAPDNTGSGRDDS